VGAGLCLLAPGDRVAAKMTPEGSFGNLREIGGDVA
jgi:hypothetical protein